MYTDAKQPVIYDALAMIGAAAQMVTTPKVLAGAQPYCPNGLREHSQYLCVWGPMKSDNLCNESGGEGAQALPSPLL